MTPKKQQRNPTFRCHLNQDRDQHGMFTNRGNGDYVNFIPNEEFLTFEITGDKGVHVISLQRAENNSVVSVATQTSLSCAPNLHPPVMQYNIPSSSNGSGFTFLHKNLEKKFCESKCPTQITPVPQPSRDCASLGGSSLDLDLSEEFAAASSDSSKDASAQNSLSENDNSNPSSQSNSSSSVNVKAAPGCANVAPAQPGGLILDKSFRSSLQSPLSSRRIVEINSNHSQRSFCTLPSSLPIQTLDSKDSSSSAGASSSKQESISANKKNGEIKFIDDPETPCVEKMSFLPNSQSSSFYVNRSHSANHLQHMAEFTNVREQSGSAFKHSQRRLTLKPNPPCGKMHCHDCIDGEKPCEKTALIGEEGFFDLACSCPAVKKPTAATPKSSEPATSTTTTTKAALKKEFHSCEDINKTSDRISKNDQSFKNLEQLARSENSSPVRRRSNAPPIEIPDLSSMVGGGDDTSEMSDSSVTVSLSIPSSPVVARKKTQRRGILYSPLLLRKMRRQKLVDSSDEDGAFSGEDMPGENFKDLESFQKAYIRRKVGLLLYLILIRFFYSCLYF